MSLAGARLARERRTITAMIAIYCRDQRRLYKPALLPHSWPRLRRGMLGVPMRRFLCAGVLAVLCGVLGVSRDLLGVLSLVPDVSRVAPDIPGERPVVTAGIPGASRGRAAVPRFSPRLRRVRPGAANGDSGAGSERWMRRRRTSTGRDCVMTVSGQPARIQNKL